MTKPIFLISLPRSGSTLLQKMLSVHEEIAATAEPWLMLPFWGMRRPDVGRAVYSHHVCADAINNFLSSFESGEALFEKCVGEFGQKMYEHAAKGKMYFLDKTPRYYLLVRMLSRLFPEAKFIILLRNPLAVLASICKTFNKGRFWWADYWIDWDKGNKALADLLSNPIPNMYVVRYEQLVTDPKKEIRQLCDWLGLVYSDEMIFSYRNNKLHGSLGDPHGIKKYSGVSRRSINKWKSFFYSRFRRRVAMNMLDRIGWMNLDALGYQREYLISELFSMKNKSFIDVSGRVEYWVGCLASYADYRYIQAKYRARKYGHEFVYGIYRPLSD